MTNRISKLTYSEELKDKIFTEKKVYDGISTGFKKLDELIGGFQNGTLTLLGGRPGMGCTALALNITLNVASKQGKTVFFFGLDCPPEQITLRLLNIEASLKTKYLSKMSSRAKLSLNQAISRLEDYPIYIDTNYSSPKDIEYIKDVCMTAENKPDFIIVDFLPMLIYRIIGKEIIKGHQIIIDNLNDRKTYILYELKHIAKTLNIPILILTSLSRAVEHRSNKYPVLTDLSLDCEISILDVVLLLYREGVYFPDLCSDEAEIIVAKNNFGVLGATKVEYKADIQRFVDAPMCSGLTKEFISKKNCNNPITYVHPLVKPILECTYGCIIYHEQILYLLHDIADYSFEEAGIASLHIAKKCWGEISKHKQIFTEKALLKGFSYNAAVELFEQITAATYTYNRSLALSRGLIVYKTAYLKCNYPDEYKYVKECNM